MVTHSVTLILSVSLRVTVIQINHSSRTRVSSTSSMGSTSSVCSVLSNLITTSDSLWLQLVDQLARSLTRLRSVGVAIVDKESQ